MNTKITAALAALSLGMSSLGVPAQEAPAESTGAPPEAAAVVAGEPASPAPTGASAQAEALSQAQATLEGEQPAQSTPPPAPASLAAFEVKRPVLAAGVRVRLRDGASVLNRPLSGASSVGAPSGSLTLGSSVDNADGTFWYVREGERALGWVSQGDLSTTP